MKALADNGPAAVYGKIQVNDCLLKVDGEPLAGILPKRSDIPDGPAAWDIYFCVEDVDETTTAVLAAGGKVIAEPFELPVGARMAVLQDPQGAVWERELCATG